MHDFEFRYPLALLLAIPASFATWRLWVAGSRERSVLALRIAAVLLLVLALAGPVHVRSDEGVDVVFVVDRSRSMPDDAEGRALELLRLAESNRPPGSRIGVVSFGGEVRLEQPLSATARFGGFVGGLDRDSSDLANGLRTALATADPDRALRLVVLSDGRSTGASPLVALPEANDRRAPIDYRFLARPADDRVSILQMDLPAQVDQGGPVLVSAWVRADRTGRYAWRLSRDGRVIERGELDLDHGTRRLGFRDVLPDGAGIHEYDLEIVAPDDATPENNRARGVVRGIAPGRILHVRAGDRPGHLGKALGGPGVEVDSIAPRDFPKSLEGFDPYRLIVLENVAVEDLGASSLPYLAAHVERFGAGLLMTGGKRSFGLGGYYLSVLDPLLPVSMELRTEHRKMNMALAVVLDRSGSMMAPAGTGLTKMDLANRGSAAAISLLSAKDQVAVIAVDSDAHLIVPLTRLDKPQDVIDRVLSIESQGGGIFVYVGLLAAGNVLSKANAATRHVILFADAADAEEPGDYVRLVAAFRAAGISVSVIGLGQDSDPDAALLQDIATRGGGRCFFSSQPAELPRLFTQDTIAVSQATFVEEETPARWTSDRHLLGDTSGAGAFPAAGGYNVTFPRPGSSVAAMTDEEDASPLVAFWHRGTGRVGVLAAEADGEFSGRFLLDWPGYVPFFRTYARWLLGPEAPKGVSLALERTDHEAVLRLEIDRKDPETAKYLARNPTALVVRAGDAERAPLEIPFLRVEEEVLEARFPLAGEGTYLAVARLGDGSVVRAPPAMLPYSPEFRPAGLSGTLEGEALLERLAESTGGVANRSMSGLFESWGVQSRTRSSLVPFLALLALLALVAEIAVRRLQLASHPIWQSAAERFGRYVPARRAATAAVDPAQGRPRAPRPLPDATGEAPAPLIVPTSPTPIAPPAPTGGGLSAAMQKAKRRAGGRMGDGGE